eukprot:749461-Hanusia_phi.AAC.4
MHVGHDADAKEERWRAGEAGKSRTGGEDKQRRDRTGHAPLMVSCKEGGRHEGRKGERVRELEVHKLTAMTAEFECGSRSGSTSIAG